MKKGKLIALILLSGFAGWIAGYLELPMYTGEFEFLSGFLLCIALGCLIYLLRTLSGLRSSHVDVSNRKALAYLTLSSVLLLMTLVIFGWQYKRETMLLEKLENQSRILEEIDDEIKSSEIESARAQIPIVLQAVQNELMQDSFNTLSESTIERLAALSRMLWARKYLDERSDSLKLISPERGQLLVSLVHMNIDSNSFMEVKRKVSFAMADLESIDLSSVDLSAINLNGANLSNTILNDANFHHANLEGASFDKSELTHACFNAANLTRTSFNWANLDSTEFVGSVLDGADLRNIRAVRGDFSNSSIQWAKLNYALLNHSDCENADFKGTDLSQATLDHVSFIGANMVRAKFNKTHLNNSQMDGVRVKGEDWISQCQNNDVSGMTDVIDNYDLVADSNSTSKFILFRKNKD